MRLPLLLTLLHGKKQTGMIQPKVVQRPKLLIINQQVNFSASIRGLTQYRFKH